MARQNPETLQRFFLIGSLLLSMVGLSSSALAEKNCLSIIAGPLATDATDLFRVLEPHIDLISPTALRIEEKAVVKEVDVKKYLTAIVTSDDLPELGLNEPLHLELRDEKAEGVKSRTATVYGRSVRQTLIDGNISFVVKPRMRKYFSVPEKLVDDPAAHESIFAEHVMFELKISTDTSDDLSSFWGIPGQVFKPRITINDEIARKIQKLNGNDPALRTTLEKLKTEVRALSGGRNKPLNTPNKVISFFDALALLLKAYPQFLEPEYLVVYERDSYRAKTPDGEYQFTVDRGTQIYEVDGFMALEALPSYLATHSPVFTASPDEVFIELKSPPAAKKNRTPLYAYLYDILTRNHLPAFKPNGGKYSLGKKAAAGM